MAQSSDRNLKNTFSVCFNYNSVWGLFKAGGLSYILTAFSLKLRSSLFLMALCNLLKHLPASAGGKEYVRTMFLPLPCRKRSSYFQCVLQPGHPPLCAPPLPSSITGSYISAAFSKIMLLAILTSEFNQNLNVITWPVSCMLAGHNG